jgi:hypothetical protein
MRRTFFRTICACANSDEAQRAGRRPGPCSATECGYCRAGASPMESRRHAGYSGAVASMNLTPALASRISQAIVAKSDSTVLATMPTPMPPMPGGTSPRSRKDFCDRLRSAVRSKWDMTTGNPVIFLGGVLRLRRGAWERGCHVNIRIRDDGVERLFHVRSQYGIHIGGIIPARMGSEMSKRLEQSVEKKEVSEGGFAHFYAVRAHQVEEVFGRAFQHPDGLPQSTLRRSAPPRSIVGAQRIRDSSAMSHP